MIYKYLVVGNASTFDTSLHYLLKLKKNQNNVEVLFCTGSKNQIINKGSYIEKFLLKNNISLYDLSDFLIINKLKILWKKIFSNNRFNYYKDRNNNIVFKFLPISFINIIENLFGTLFLSNKKLDIFFKNTDYLLIDFRHKYESFGKKNIEKILIKKNIKNILLLPHACHYTRPFDEFKGIESKNCISFPINKTTFWIPMYYDELNKYSKFKYKVLGYPELNNCLLNQTHYKSKNSILILVRNFKIDNSTTNNDSFVYEKEENLIYFKFFLDMKKKYFKEKEFIFKLHPKISENLFKEFIEDLWPDKNYKIVYDSIFGYLDDIFLSISTYSTLNIVTISKKIPTIIINCRFHKYVNEWSLIKKIYNKLNFFSKDLKICERNIKYILNNDITDNLNSDIELIKKIWLIK